MPDEEPRKTTDPRRVMVVHGRNDKARNAVFSFLRALGLAPIEWEEAIAETGQGAPHNFEAVRAAMEVAQAVVVIFTAEDQARLLEPLASHYDIEDLALRGQPRQNVLIEAGLAMGIDHRRTILVELGPIRRPSDFDGLNAVRLSNDPSRRTALRSRLETAGCALPSHTSDWLSSDLGGDFEAAAIPWAPEALGETSEPTAAAAPPKSTPPHDSAAIPGKVPLLDLLDFELDPTSISARWTRHDPNLETPLGSSSSGVLHLDLTADGPHGLIAGTTGSGKSELLQSLIAGLALNHSPRSLNFLLLDYKGGAAFRDCLMLPHTTELVTDLSSNLGRRLVVSLDAELRRRESILRAAGAKDHRELRQRSPEDTPPALVILIDEYATLIKEMPHVVDGIVDVGQRGRSLGVFLLLATQRPGAVVTGAIRANTNIRIALRLASSSESEDVVGSTDAARIPRQLPGRAFLRTSFGELVQFQSAYVGSASRGGAAASDLEAIVQACREAAARSSMPPPRPTVLPPLPVKLRLDDLPQPPTASAAVGLIDEPRLQQQRPYVVDFEARGGVLVLGTSGSGKTTALQTIAASLARGSRTRDVNIYGLDFGGGSLAPLEALPHCGSIIDGSDEERVTELILFLKREIERRRQDGIGPEGSSPSLPRIVVLIDGYAAFSAQFERRMAVKLSTLSRA